MSGLSANTTQLCGRLIVAITVVVLVQWRICAQKSAKNERAFLN